jgi:hypothetical protein
MRPGHLRGRQRESGSRPGGRYDGEVIVHGVRLLAQRRECKSRREILNAARPALAKTQGSLIAISSPYARRGALWETYKRHYGANWSGANALM